MITIEFANVTKTYILSKGKYGLLTETLGENLWGFLRKRADMPQKVYALKNVSFSVNAGEVVGIIGRNGAGKSTILKLISKISYPESGIIHVNGKTGAFIELGAGLHPELTGRENIFLYGAILGMKNNEIAKRFADIVDFAEIRKFLDVPIKRYSSGMYSRLGFSVCAFCNPDILLVDEVLAVGDVNFQKKSLLKMQEFAKSGKTIIFVSHDLDAIRKICTRVILLDHGEIKKTGNAKAVISTYLAKYAKMGLE